MNKKKLKNYIKVAQSFSERSHDTETKVGSILVHKKTGAVMGMAFNGFVRGADDAKLPTTRPRKYDYMQHSEMNLIFNAARHGINMSNCIVICTLSPCVNCLRALWQTGIDEIYYKDTYKDFNKNLEMKDLIINLTKIDEYTKITLKGSKNETIITRIINNILRSFKKRASF